VLRGGLGLAVIGLASMGLLSSVPLLIVTSVLFVTGIALAVPSLVSLVGQFVTGIALAVPSLVSLVGQLGGKSRGIAVSVYTFILFAGTSLGPVLSIRLMNLGSDSLTFVLLALILGIGFLAACLIRRDTPEQAAAAD